jgi:hypothetical protein
MLSRASPTLVESFEAPFQKKFRSLSTDAERRKLWAKAVLHYAF